MVSRNINRSAISDLMDDSIRQKVFYFTKYGMISVFIFCLIIFIFNTNLVTSLIGSNFIGDIAHQPLYYMIVCVVFLLNQEFGERLKVLNNALSLLVGLGGVLALFAYFGVFGVNLWYSSVTNNTLYLAFIFISYCVMLLSIVNKKGLFITQMFPIFNVLLAFIGIMYCFADPVLNIGIIINFLVLKVFLSSLLFNACPDEGFIWIFYLDTPASQFLRYGIFGIPIAYTIPASILISLYPPGTNVFPYITISSIAMLFILLLLITYSRRVGVNDLEGALAMEEIDTNRDYYESLIQNMSGGVLATDNDDNIIYINKSFSGYFGLNEKILIGTPFFDNQWYFSILFDEYNQAKDTKKPVFVEYKEIVHFAGAKYISGWITPIIRNDNFGGVVMTVIDVSTLEETSTISAVLDDKNVLLSEVHDRVKNNMQIILSLLNIQSHNAKNEDVREAVIESQQRINTMALVHEKLYQNLDFSQVNIQKYIDVLIDEVIKVYAVPDNVTFERDILNTNFDIDTTIPLGLIINELLTNCAKYAFPNGREGVVSIKLRKNKENLKEFYLEIADNGVGLANDNVQNMGLKIVDELSHQLSGSSKIYSDMGVRVGIVFSARDNIPDDERL